ncbi:MAG TPA: prepilin-type N-terminal cleavage/methylation domain-containing protein [Vicinamibacteria bacterium]|nr:prepilin-type N-terminal cleavage/methylation domain-containing protein [Vicinamibacteria bacterium]
MQERGFSLLEALIALTITLVVMGLLAQTMRQMRIVYRTESDRAAKSSAAALAFDDITYELSNAGQGLGEDVLAVVPASSETLTVRSNPDLAAIALRTELRSPTDRVVAWEVEEFPLGKRVLVASSRGQAERAVVVASAESSLGFRSIETVDGSFRAAFRPEDGARAMGLREVHYFIEDGNLIKEVVGVARRVLLQDAKSLAVEYLDSEGESLAFSRPTQAQKLAAVKIELRDGVSTLRTAVALAPRSGTVDFESALSGFRLSRVFYPIERPAGVASRTGADWGVVLSSGTRPYQDPAYLYTFPIEQGLMAAQTENVVWLEDVRNPVALTFGPESGPLAGSLFVAASGLRVGHLARLTLDGSEESTFEGTEAVAQAGGIAFGPDGGLYVAAHEKGAIFRFMFDETGEPRAPERLFSLPGTPAGLAEGSDGHLYVLVNGEDGGSIWKVAFDETLSPVGPVEVGKLPGKALSLSCDPVGGNLFALVRDSTNDFIVVELESIRLRGSSVVTRPRVIFSLRRWQVRLEEGRVEPRELPFPLQELPERMTYLRTNQVDFIAFDSLGSLYMGARERNLVLKFQLDRPSGRYAVGVAGGVVGGSIRIHAWKKTTLGR